MIGSRYSSIRSLTVPCIFKMSVEESKEASCNSLSVLVTLEARFEPKLLGDRSAVTVEPRGDRRPETSCWGAESPYVSINNMLRSFEI